jgi:crotonobetainyl-CoA:carnitine CoA-transferase CaiB-like acyl-CoA transferase
LLKLEPPEHLEASEPPGGPREGPDFQNLHRNKRSLTLDLKSKHGVEVLQRLAARADVIVENFRPDVKTRLGIDYPALSKVNPRLVYASISGFGQDGPYRDRPGVDQIAQGMGGLMSITGEPGRGPMRVGIPIADLTAGLFAALGILVALFEREESGKGQEVQTSLLQSQIFMLDFQASRWLNAREVPKQAGNNHPTSIPTGVFKTSDGHINVAAVGGTMWERLCHAIGAEALLTDPAYATAAARSKNRDALNAVLDTYFVQRPGAEWVEKLNAAGVPCGPIYSMDQVFADPQVEHLGIVQSLDKLRVVGQPMTLGRTPSRLVAKPPGRGEHTSEVLREAGFSEAEIESLRKGKVI